MQHVLQTGKRAFSAAVAAATIAFSVGAGALLAPTSASAASAGDVIRGTSLSTVYFYGYDGMRYAFPNEKPFKLVKENPEEGKKKIQELVVGLFEIAELLEPILPETSAKIKSLIKENKMPDKPLFERKD